MRGDKAADSWPDASIYRYRWNCGIEVSRDREKGQFLARRLRHVIKRYTPFRTPTAFHGVPPRSASHAEEKLSPCRAAIYVYILTHEYRETSDRRVCNLPLPGFVPVVFIPNFSFSTLFPYDSSDPNVSTNDRLRLFFFINIFQYLSLCYNFS